VIAGNRTQIALTLAAVAMATLVTTTCQVGAAELVYDATVQVSDNEGGFNVSVFPGKAGYDNGTVSGIFGDGTIMDYRFLTADSDSLWSWADGGAGIVAPVQSPPAENVAGPINESQNWPDVWITSDPDTDPADFTTDTQAGAQNITGTIDISGLRSGTLYFIYGTYFDSITLSLTMSGPGQAGIEAEYSEDPPDTVNMGWITSFTFSKAGAYDTITYSYTNADTDGSRARFMGVIVDGMAYYPMKASDPSPKDGAIDVLHNATLSWTPGMYAYKHDVYVGESFEEVEAATVPTAPGLGVNSFDPGRLEFDKTYFWRVDEVNAPPDSTVFEGELWSFTTEPLAYPVDGQTITATASSADVAYGPEKTIDGSGLTGDRHSNDLADMWLTAMGATGPAWITYEFEKVLQLNEMWVWNQNGSLESTVGLGAKDVLIEYSTDGTEYTILADSPEFAQAAGLPGYAPNTIVDLRGIVAKYVRLTINNNWGGLLEQYGLSEVRFFSVPVAAREPAPISGATEVAVDAVLSWRAGREAVVHDVYLGTDEQAVVDGTAPVDAATESSYAPALDLATTYFWRIDEVNDAETPSIWAGPVWNFSTPEYLVVDDFESYTNYSPNRVFQAWIDGLGFSPDDFFPNGNNGNGSGSLIGYDPMAGDIMETTVVHSGSQSMAFVYDNTSATYSEATRTFAGSQDWSLHGIKALVLWFYGANDNVPQQMYVKINNTKVPYDGGAENLQGTHWQMWYIDVTALNVSNVSTLTVGFERIGGAGGQGSVLLDDLRLYPRDRELVTPVAPDAAGLKAHWKLDENSGSTATDSSGFGNNGTLTNMTGTTWTTGIVGGALGFDGVDDYVDCGNDPSLQIAGEFTIAAWVKMAPVNEGAYMGIGGKMVNGDYKGFALVRHSSNVFRLWVASAGTILAVSSDGTYTDTEWHHVAGVSQDGVNSLYVDGFAQAATLDAPFDDSGEFAFIGKQYSPQDGRYWNGTIDDVRIYDRVLSLEELAGLAGQTEPFDKPF